MTKKDYKKFANLFAGELALARASKNSHRIQQVQVIILSTADIFAHDNERFDRQRFYDACKPKKQKEKVQVKDPTCVLCDYGEVHEH